MRNHKYLFFVSVTVSILIFTVFFTVSCSKKNTVDKVVMTYVSAPLNVPSVIEKEQGQFEDAFNKLGLKIEYSDLTSGADQTAALASGDIHILNAVGVSSVILAAANGSDIVILSMYSKAPKAFCMFSNDKTINSPEDLRGLTIAGPKGTNLHELLVVYLASAGMTINDVKYVNMDIPSAVAALEGHSIDVALVGGAAAYNCEKAGKHLVADGDGLISSVICTAASRKFVNDNPEIIKTFLETQRQIVDYMNSETDTALKITAKSLDMEESAVRDMFSLYDFTVEITEADIESMQATESFLFNNDMIENHVDMSKLVYKF